MIQNWYQEKHTFCYLGSLKLRDRGSWVMMSAMHEKAKLCEAVNHSRVQCLH